MVMVGMWVCLMVVVAVVVPVVVVIMVRRRMTADAAQKRQPAETMRLETMQALRAQLEGGCVGHRGCRGLREEAPENTLAAFMEAERHPSVAAVELDVQLTSDRRLVVFHDSDVTRLLDREDADGPSGVAQLPLHTIQRLRHRSLPPAVPLSEFTRVPTLKAVLRWLMSENTSRGRPLPVIVELKQPGAEEALREVVALLEELREGLPVERHCWLACFDPRVLRSARRLVPSLPTCQLVFGSPLEAMRGAAAGELGQGHADERRALRRAWKRLNRSRCGRMALLGPVARLLDAVWNAFWTSRLLRWLVGYSLIAVTPDLASRHQVHRRLQDGVLTLVWTINSPSLKAQLEANGAFVITDTAIA